MKINFYLWAVVMMCAGSAYGIKTPSETEVDDIQRQIHIAKRRDKQIGAAEALVLKARKEKQPQEHILALEKLVENEKNIQHAARTKAIHMTIEAYGLEPANKRGTSVVRLTKGREVEWLPISRDRESRNIQNAAGEAQHIAQPKKELAGKTYPDGVVYIYPEAFQKGVGFLASTLLHESVHFEQITTPGRGDKLRRAESEVEAYQAEKDNERYFFDPNNPADLVEINATAEALASEKNAAAEDRRERAKLLNRLRGLVSVSVPIDMFESKLHTNAELADISGLVAQARGQAEIARREREEREAIKRAAAEKASQRDHDARLKRTLGELALRSCANPGSVTQAELDALPRPYNENFHYGNLPAGLEGADGTGYCTEPFTYMAMGAGRRLDAEEVKRLSIPMVAVQPVPVPRAPAPIRSVPASTNSMAIRAIRYVSQQACATPPQPFDRELAWIPWSEFRHVTDAQAQERGLSACELRVYRRLVEFGQSWQPGQTIGPRAVYAAAAEPSSGFEDGGGGATTPEGCIRGDNSRRNCIACGNRHCD